MQAVPIAKDDLTLSNPSSINKQSIEELQKAFHAFTSMSEHLSDSYHVLEKRVVELSGELASLSEQRLKELKEKEQLADQLESLLSLMPAAVIVIDNKGIIRQANPTAEQWIQRALKAPEVIPMVGQPWAKIVRAVFAPKQSDYHEVSLRDGRLVSLDTSPLDNSGQLIMMTDQTETRALQAKVSRQERLTAMGQMVASLAHQIRTPLSAAMLYASNLKNPSLDVELRTQFADKLVGRLNHLEKQVQDMLLFVKGEVQLINRLTVNDIVLKLKEATSGLSEEKQALIEWQIDAEAVCIQCQCDVLVSAFMNVINNALEAQGEQQTPVTIHTALKNERLVFVFKDQGPGLKPEQIQKIQEPFYTTKSYGTGLGIPVLMATVKAHKGDVEIISLPGEGSEFHISLPVANKG